MSLPFIRRARLGLLVLAGLALAPTLAAQGPMERAGSAAPAERPEIADALREFYLRGLARELDLPETEATRIEPRVRSLLDAQAQATRDRIEAARGVLRAALLPLDATGADRASAADAVAGVAAQERASAQAIAAARARVLSELKPRQAARFLAFELRFQDRVRRLVEERRAGGPPGGEPGGEPGDETGGDRHERGPDAQAPDQRPRLAPRARPRGPMPPRPDADRGDMEDREALHGTPAGRRGGPFGAPHDRDGGEAERTMLIVMTHELRQRLELTDEQALQMLPRLQAFHETRMRVERERRGTLESLRESAADPAVSDAKLRDLVASAVRESDQAPASMAAARDAVTAGLSPVQTARFLVIAHRAEREMRGMARRLGAGRAGGPGGADSRPAMQDRLRHREGAPGGPRPGGPPPRGPAGGPGRPGR